MNHGVDLAVMRECEVVRCRLGSTAWVWGCLVPTRLYRVSVRLCGVDSALPRECEVVRCRLGSTARVWGCAVASRRWDSGRLSSARHRIPLNNWWLKLRPLLRILAKHESTYQVESITGTGAEVDIGDKCIAWPPGGAPAAAARPERRSDARPTARAQTSGI